MASLLSCCLSYAIQAVAAETGQPVELVSVTGYSIKRTDSNGPAPVEVFDRPLITQSGAATLEEFFRYLPQALGQVSETAQGSFSGAGVIDLRGIGIDNTLVLLNGKRVSSYARNGASEPFVDINMIPVVAIDRVEVLKDGASAIYGADAVAGVVNIILRDQFDGLAVGGGYLSASEGDGEELNADVLWGGKLGQAQVLASLSWMEKSPILARNRDGVGDVDFSAEGGPNFRAFNSTPSNYFMPGSFVTLIDDECGVNPRIAKIVTHPFFGDFCGFNFAYFSQLTYDTERLVGNFVARRDLGAVNGRLEVFLSTRDNRARIAPSPVVNPTIPADHPNNPFGALVVIAARPLDTGDRVFDTNADTYRVMLGLDGNLGRWDWSADLLATGNNATTRRRNALYEDRYQDALNGIGGPGGNLYYNPFGANPQNDPALIDWLTTETRFGADTRENSLELMGTTYFGQPGGRTVDFAAGLQFRQQDLEEFADETERSGRLAGGSQITQISADRDILAGFVEFGVPVLDSVEAQLAGRFDHYSDFGTTINPKIALAWRPNDQWTVRGSYSTSFRPPTFTELFNPSVLNSGFFVDSVRCAVTGEPADCAPREYPLRNVGNPGLDPEQGESAFFGIGWSPGFASGLDLQLDFWRFDHTDRIIELDPQVILDGGGDNGVMRAAPSADDMMLGIPGPILELTETFENSDQLETAGIDLLARYGLETASAGKFSWTLSYTYVDEYRLNEASLGSAATDTNFAGRYFNFDLAIPRDRADLNFTWRNGQHAVTANLHRIGDYQGLFPLHENGVPTDTPLIVDAYTTLDLQYSLSLNSDATEIVFGCRNCTDKQPPVTFNFRGEGLYDYRGALLYARLRHSLQ